MMALAFQSVNLCLRGLTPRLGQVCTPLLSQAVSRRCHSQDATAQKIGLCYLSGRGSFPCNVDQYREVFLPRENLTLSKKGIHTADKPNNAIKVRINGMNLTVKTPIIPITLTEDAIEDFKALNNIKEIFETKEKEFRTFKEQLSLEMEGRLEKKINDMTSTVSEHILSYITRRGG